MNTWRISGIALRASGPGAARHRPGTRRQPSSSCPSSRTTFSKQLLDTRCAARTSRGQEDHADAVRAGARAASMRGALGLAAEERVGNLHQDAGAVAGERIAAAGAAVREVAQHLEALARRSRATRSPLMLATKPTPQASCSMRRVAAATEWSSMPMLHDALRYARCRCAVRLPARRARLPAERRQLVDAAPAGALGVRREHDHGLRARHAVDRADRG